MAPKFQFVIDCVNATGEFINYIVDNNRAEDVGRPRREQEVTYATFRRNCDLSPWRGEIDFAHDWAISYHKSVAPSGVPIFYFRWSGIEHVFWPDGEPFDLEQETELAEVAAELDAAAWDEISRHRKAAGTAWHLDGLGGHGGKWAYHGTHSGVLPQIAERGLVPELYFIYFSQFLDSGTLYAQARARRAGAAPVVLRFPWPADAEPNPDVDVLDPDPPVGEFAIRRGVAPVDLQMLVGGGWQRLPAGEEPLRLELVCGSTAAPVDHPGYWFTEDAEVHPGQQRVAEEGRRCGVRVDVTSHQEDDGVYSDAYVRFFPQQLSLVVAMLDAAGHPGDILDIQGKLTSAQRRQVIDVARRLGWQVNEAKSKRRGGLRGRDDDWENISDYAGFNYAMVSPEGRVYLLDGDSHPDWCNNHREMFGFVGGFNIDYEPEEGGSFDAEGGIALDYALNNGWIRVKPGGGIELAYVEGRVDLVKRLLRRMAKHHPGRTLYIDGAEAKVQVPVTATGRPDFSELDDAFPRG